MDANRPKKITPRQADHARWYLDIIDAAGLAEPGAVEGTTIIKPHGYAIWSLIQKGLGSMIEATGAVNACFPMLLPERSVRQGETEQQGVPPEFVAAIYAGGKRLKEALILRPNSEAAVCEAFARWIRSRADLPMAINQWGTVVRWEARPEAFVRTTEMLCQEGYSAHAVVEEAEERVRIMCAVYEKFAREFLALPVITGAESPKKGGGEAFRSYTVECAMKDGFTLQFATSRNLGTKLAELFGIRFVDYDGVPRPCFQTSWELRVSAIGATIMTHSDDLGLILPPKVAPVQIVLVPIWSSDASNEAVTSSVRHLNRELKRLFRVEADLQEGRPGEKFFKWEQKGVPLRIEIGRRETKTGTAYVIRRDTGEKTSVPLENIERRVLALMESIHENLYERARNRIAATTIEAHSWDELTDGIRSAFLVVARCVTDTEVLENIEKETGVGVRCIPLTETTEQGACIFTSKRTGRKVLFAKPH